MTDQALHYKESEFQREPSVPVLEALISINNKLGQKEAAAGLLEWGKENLRGELKVRERWYEKLHEWEKALEAYRRKGREQEGQVDPEVLLGQMRCMEALGEWGELHTLSEGCWGKVGPEVRQRMARMASTAAWGRGEWGAMQQSVALLPRYSSCTLLAAVTTCWCHPGTPRTAPSTEPCSACTARTGRLPTPSLTSPGSLAAPAAPTNLQLPRDMLDTELTALSAESYQRAYPIMVQVQMLAELEEVIEYKQVLLLLSVLAPSSGYFSTSSSSAGS